MKKKNISKLISKEYLIVYSLILHIAQISVIIFILTEPNKSHSHNYAENYHSHPAKSHNHDYNYAEESHNHSTSDITFNSNDYGSYGSLQKEINDLKDKLDDSHTHSATDITYKSFEFGSLGSLQRKIKEIDDKAEQNHTHDAFDLYGVPSHTHDAFDLYGVAKSYHTHY